MNRIRTLTLFACAAATTACADAGSGEVSVTVGDVPLAEAVDLGGEQLAFTGRYVMNEDATMEQLNYAIDLGELVEGQPVHPDLTIDAFGNPESPRFALGYLHTLARIEHAGAQNLQLDQVRMDFKFSTGSYEVERPVSALLRSEVGSTYVQVPLIAGLGELQLIQQRFQAEAAMLGTPMASLELELVFEGTSLDGGATFASTTTIPIDMCIDCEEYGVQSYAMGVVTR